MAHVQIGELVRSISVGTEREVEKADSTPPDVSPDWPDLYGTILQRSTDSHF